jgi:hypothetical protein
MRDGCVTLAASAYGARSKPCGVDRGFTSLLLMALRRSGFRGRPYDRSIMGKRAATWAGPMQGALLRTGGARFYRCAFQVNPFEYLGRHGHTPGFADERSYNEAIVQECLAQGIEVLAVTDHSRVKTAETLWTMARSVGLIVFPGFEALTKDGVHILCLFELDKTADALERVLGDCGIHTEADASPVGKYSAEEFLRESRRWGALCIAAHVAGAGGLLKTRSGTARMAAWKSPDLHACSLPGPVSNAPDDLRPILENDNPSYKRNQAVAVVNAKDVGSRGGCASWGLRVG